jgi:hypothetical protein
MTNCTNCGRNFWTCHCENFGFVLNIAKVHKYEIVDKVQIPDKPKYRVLLKNGQYVTEPIEYH